MIGSQKVLGVIPARGGSKGLVGKNIRLAHGRPLLAWTIDAARASKSVDRVVISTDDDGIMAVALSLGCDVPFRRPDHLATDTATSIDVVLHALDALPGFDTVVLLQPTSPLRTGDDIDNACALYARTGGGPCVSVSVVDHSPYLMYQLAEDLSIRPLLPMPDGATRRQDLPVAFALNGAIYISSVGDLRTTRTFITSHTVAYVMPQARSLDIDTISDFDAFSNIVNQCPNV